MGFDSRQVANWFIERAAREGEYLTQMKLQKLVYIAHGWHLALLGKPLISENVEAWKWGPVIRSLYRDFVNYGAMPITATAVVQPARFPDDTAAVLERVWDVYHQFTAAQLSEMTHRLGTPWSATDREADRPVIPNDAIKEHYLELASRRTNVSTGSTPARS